MLQVELYAEYNPQRLMPFLRTSQAYSLEAALQQCEAKRLVREQVFLLGRMGNSVRALDLIIQQLADIPEVFACPAINLVCNVLRISSDMRQARKDLRLLTLRQA